MSPPAAIPVTSEFRSPEVHEVLRNERRQHVIEILRAAGDRMEARELANDIAEAETGQSPPPDNIRQSVHVALHQTHLPKLDDLEIVAYDTRSKTVELLERGEDMAVYMESVEKYGIAWSEYYLGVSLGGLLSIVAAEMGVPVVASIGSVTLAIAALIVIVGSALYQTVIRQSSIVHRL